MREIPLKCHADLCAIVSNGASNCRWMESTKENPHTHPIHIVKQFAGVLERIHGKSHNRSCATFCTISRDSRFSLRFRLDRYLCSFSYLSLLSHKQQLKPKRTKQFKTNISNWSNETRWDRIKPPALPLRNPSLKWCESEQINILALALQMQMQTCTYSLALEIQSLGGSVIHFCNVECKFQSLVEFNKH